jgi:hypothetical protein
MRLPPPVELRELLLALKDVMQTRDLSAITRSARGAVGAPCA